MKNSDVFVITFWFSLPYHMATSPHQFLTEKLAYYYLTFFQCSDRVRHYGSSCGDAESRLVYEEAIKQWRGDATNPLRQPPPGPEDQLKSDAFFAACDSMCSLEPQNLHEYVLSSIHLVELMDIKQCLYNWPCMLCRDTIHSRPSTHQYAQQG